MKIFLSLVFLFIWGNGRTAQAQTIAKFDQTQFEQAEFGRSSLVTDALSKASVIGLGEGTHSMGTIFTAKVKFIKFLHEQMGYHTIAFESGIYDVYKANEALGQDNVSTGQLLRGLNQVWSCREMEALMQYIIETQQTEHPLRLVGFDCAFSGRYASTNFLIDLHGLVDSINSHSSASLHIPAAADIAIMQAIQKSMSYQKVWEKDTVLLYTTTEKIRNAIRNHQLDTAAYFQTWTQILGNMQVDYRKLYEEHYSLRDSMMAENIIWAKQQLRDADQKIVVWGTSLHLALDKTSVRDAAYQTMSAGNLLQRQLGSRYYALAFIPGTGTGGSSEDPDDTYRIAPPSRRSIAQVFYSKPEIQYGFLSLTDPQNQAYLEKNKVNRANFFWKKELPMDCAEVFNGVFFIREVIPPHY